MTDPSHNLSKCASKIWIEYVENVKDVNEFVNGIFLMQAAVQEYENRYVNADDDGQSLVDAGFKLDLPVQFSMKIAQILLSESPILINGRPCQSVVEGLTNFYLSRLWHKKYNCQSNELFSIFTGNLDGGVGKVDLDDTPQMKLINYLKKDLPKSTIKRLDMRQFEITKEFIDNDSVLKDFVAKNCPNRPIETNLHRDDRLDHFTPFIQYNLKCAQRVIQKTTEMANQSSHFTHNPKSNATRSRRKHSNYNNGNVTNGRKIGNNEEENGMYEQNSYLMQHQFTQMQSMNQQMCRQVIPQKNTQQENFQADEAYNGIKRKEVSNYPGDLLMGTNKRMKVMDPEMEKYESLIGGDISEEIINWVLKMKLSHVEKVLETDIVGLYDVKKMIKDKIIYPILRPDLHKGLHRAPKGILFFGPPGTGKTTLAKWIASQSNATFFEVSPSSITSKYHGETESIIRALFMVAELNAPSVLFIDEVDSVLAKRKDNDEDYSIRMKTQLLQMMDGLTNKTDSIVIVVAATNRPEILDDAGLRRFTRRILIPLPNHESRMLFIRNILTKHQTSSYLKDEHLAEISDKTEGWSGSDLLNLCTKAAEFSYDETIQKHGGIENVPDSSAFRAISIEDLRKSLDHIKPSSLANDKLDDWGSCFGSK